MADYRTLGATPPIAAVADTTGLNTGNLTTTIDLTSIGAAHVGQAEIYHMVTRNVPGGGQANIKWNENRDFGFVYPNVGSEWWGECYMRPGDSLQFFWNIASSSATIPTVTAWWRYDADLPENAS